MSSAKANTRQAIRWRVAVACGLVSLMGGGCGVVGSPVPPEYVGVAPTIEQQKRKHAMEPQRKEAGADQGSFQEPIEPIPQEQDLELPPLRPVGTR